MAGHSNKIDFNETDGTSQKLKLEQQNTTNATDAGKARSGEAREADNSTGARMSTRNMRKRDHNRTMQELCTLRSK